MAQLPSCLLIAHEFEHKAVVQDWSNSFKNGKLLASLKRHWKTFVPVIYAPGQESAKEERLSHKLIFHPLETFLCGGDPETEFKQLKEKDAPSQICGHVFKHGEPSYSCRDCANDLTCVLCINCFQQSVHKKHRYRMSISSGGGYCDCGDVEAWKSGPHCETHGKGTSLDEVKDRLASLPDELIARASDLFISVLQYAIDMMTWESYDSLPFDLRPDGEPDDLFVTILFNDELHTFDQVINTLQKAVDCSAKQAADFSTTVDREGRSGIKTGGFNVCDKARKQIEQMSSRGSSKPLKVQVMHTTVVSHQKFALKSIQWLQYIISKSDGLRYLFCKLAMQPAEGGSLMERLILADTKLWKIARIQSHQLLMSGVLRDQECKRQFGVMFTEHYAQLMQNFIKDDHLRSVSIISDSLQIFTAPKVARFLITEHNLLGVILQTFLKQCESKKNKRGKLSFGRSENGNSFKRAWFILYDLKYALLCKPSAEEWTDQLKKSFCNGFNALLDLLISIQGMDSVTRKTGQHLEIEPEWESAFNLQLRLQDNIALFLDWCGSNASVFSDCFRSTLCTLYQCRDKLDAHKMEDCDVAGIVAQCIKYDVASQPVSIHLPVIRLFAGLYLHMDKFGICSPEMISQFEMSPVDLIEPPLRTQVMIAQNYAGMWRRNGFSLLNQIFFYNNVRCRVEMYDKDIVMLQIGASLLNPDEFLIHLLNKYGLLAWVKSTYDDPGGQEDSVRQTSVLAEEFLNLLIIILGERYTVGVGQVTHKDVVKREIIHQLCITPMAHSELVKALPEDWNHETGIELVVNEVANFKKSQVGGKGHYELKPEYCEQYNPYFYHYSRSEQSKSEESQMKKKKQAGEDRALPPPAPPRFCKLFAGVRNVLSCDVMIHIMTIVLSRTAAERSRSWSETQFERVMHLIGLALHEQKAAYENNEPFEFLAKATKDGQNILKLLHSVVGSENLTHEYQSKLLKWVLNKFSAVRKMENEFESISSINNLSSTYDVKREQEKKKKAELAAKRRQRIMSQLSAMQRSFIQDNPTLCEMATSGLTSAWSDMDLSVFCSSSELTSTPFPVALGCGQTSTNNVVPIKAVCILCQEDQEISYNARVMVLSALVQRSSVLSQSRGKHINNEDEDPLFMSSDLFCGTHTSSCGHVMHADCWQRYFDAIAAKERRRPFRYRNTCSYNIEKLEFLCPLCGAISNTVIPMLPPLSTLRTVATGCDIDQQKAVDLSFNDWLDGIQKTVQASVKAAVDKESEDESLLFQPCPISTITKLMAESVAKNFTLLWNYVYDDNSGHFSESMREMMKKFATDVYTFGLAKEPDGENPCVPIMVWNTCAYTIQVIEQSLQHNNKPLFGSLPSRRSDCLVALVKFAAVCSQVMSADTVKQHCIRLLTALIPDGLEKKHEPPCILDLDMFHYLTVLVMSLPTLYAEGQTSLLTTFPTGSLNDQHALQLVLTAHLVQILLVYEPESQDMMEMECDTDDDGLVTIYKKLREKAGLSCDACEVCPWTLATHLKQACLPFLRCAALMYHCITGVSTPPELQENSSNQFEYICRFLALPTKLTTLFENQGDIISELMARWCSHPSIKDHFTASNQKIIRYPLPLNHLVKLPKDYSELMNQVSSYTCPRSSGDESRVPTMCLVCGQVLCSHSYCCQVEVDKKLVGAATAHSHVCGAGIGIFLRIRDCQIFLLAGQNKGCFQTAPYLDDYGETDQLLKRGNPLCLSEEHYKQLHRLWFQHEIPETIVHNLESNNSQVSYEWWNL
ncbi:E3 ubiquitin-protein ligase UBR2 isoform X2 [Octopus sinensis]|uniref:E3 ubiquitin-protein ligase n=1 Tax=Octopus sinensis TaxID=2607531 RepID=A0A7E6F7Q0_9MOLL|nr:E3 ubiquitin-protein ligase UBR2 isoform X2 [Octopus sinensis]